MEGAVAVARTIWTMSRRARVLAPLLVGFVVTGLFGCGGESERGLPIESTEWADATHLYVYTECATLTEVDVDRAGELVDVTLGGAPKDGDCRDWAVIKLEAGTAEITDGTTDEVVKLPVYTPAPDGGGHGS